MLLTPFILYSKNYKTEIALPVLEATQNMSTISIVSLNSPESMDIHRPHFQKASSHNGNVNFVLSISSCITRMGRVTDISLSL